MTDLLPRRGDVVLVEQGLGVVRFVGDVDFEKGKHIGLEIKGNNTCILHGSDGSVNGKRYFVATPNNGLFIQLNDIIRIITSEEILTKLAILYDIVTGRTPNSNFVQCSKYNEILKENENFQQSVYQQNILIQNLSQANEALEAMNNNNNNRNITPNHNNNNNNNSTGSDRGESDDTKNDDSDSIPTDDEYDEEEDTPLPTDDNFEIILNDDDDYDEMDIQQLSNITFKCIQSASATQAGTSKGKSKTNQDSLIVLDSFGPSSLFQLYGVCDGHGPNGNHVAKFVTDNFPNILNNLLSSNNNCNQTLSITSILKQSFITIESQLSQLQSQNELAFDINYSGTTATIGLFAGNKLYVANIGDSRTVLGKIPPKHKTVPISFALSNDHDPKNKSEMIRIKKSKSAKILYDDNDARIQIEIPEIIQNANLLSVGNVPLCNNSDKKTPKTKHRRTQSQVKKISASVSRSIGDKIAHKYGGLISQPEIIVHELSEADIFVIFASDGIWQMIDNDDVMRTVGTKLNQNKEVEMYADLQKTTSKLVREANISWQDEYEDYTDDITCVIARIGKIN